MSGFTSLRKGECPICGDAGKKHSNNCQVSQSIKGLYFCRASLVDSSIQPMGFKFLGETRCGTWAKWVELSEDGERNPFQQARWNSQIRDHLAKHEKERQQWLANLPTIKDRNRDYRHINSILGLSKPHRQHLKEKRRLTEPEIGFAFNQCWIRTWEPCKRVDVNSNIAGVDKNGKLLGVTGISIATCNSEGHIVGHQIAADNRDKYGKYIWLSSKSKGGNGPHQPNGELPLHIWRHPDCQEPTETWLVEGSLKSLIVALKIWFRDGQKDVQIIGASGANFYGSKQTLEDALACQITEMVVLCPDAGSLDNSAILSHYRKTINHITSLDREDLPLGYTVNVAWWNQFEKGIDPDADEREDIYFADVLSVDEFEKLISDRKQKPSETPQDVSETNFDWAWEKWVKSREFTPDILVHQDEFQFPKLPESNAIISVKSGLGTNKTGAMIELMKTSNNRSFLDGYRNNLLYQSGSRASENNVTIYHLRVDDGKLFIADVNTNLSFCLDSIAHLDGYFEGVDLYLDEACSVLLHAVTGGTLGDEQAKVLKIFSRALEQCNRVIMLDGNLSDLYVELISKLAPNKKVVKIENTKKSRPHKFTFVDGIDVDGEVKKRDKSPLLKAIANSDCIPFITSDSKLLTDVLDEYLKAHGKTGILLNKDTVGEPWAKEMLENPNDYILKTKPEYVIGSPTIESGVSITLTGYFTHHSHFYCGIQNTNSQYQAAMRLRDNTIPHYVFCPEKAIVRDRNNPHTYSEKAFARLREDKIIQSALLASQYSENPTRCLEVIGNAIAKNNDHWWEFSAKLGALDNFEKDNYRRCFAHVLKEAGHDVEFVQWNTDDEVKDREKEAKESVRLKYALELYTAVEFETVEEANQIAKSNPSKETQRRIERTRLLDRLPGIKQSGVWSSEFIADCYLKDKHFISKQQRYWFLTNFEIAKKRHEVDWYYAATKEDFFMASLRQDSHLKLWALQELNILQFLEGEFYRDSPAVVNLINTVRERSDIAQALNITIRPATESRKENIETLRSLLDSIGIKLAKPKQKLVNGVRERVYFVDEQAMQAPARLEVLKAIERKYTDYLNSELITKISWQDEPLQEPAQVEVEIIGTQMEQASTHEEIVKEVYSFELEPQLVAITTDDAIALVDDEIKKASPIFDARSVSSEHLWSRRLSRALMISPDIARRCYQALPHQLIHNVWSILTDGVQRDYCNLFGVTT